MRNRIAVIILLIVCLGLGVAIMLVKKQAAEQHQQDAAHIDSVSNEVVKVQSDLTEQKQVNTNLEKDIEAKTKQFDKSLTDLTNNFTQVSESLVKTEANLKTAEEQVKERDAKISDLEAQNQALDKKAESLTNQITSLSTQITETRQKLAASEGDKAYLEKTLKGLMAEKAELERQFNDLAVLRAQVSKLKSEQAIARRLEWSRTGLLANTEEKGAQRLMQGFAAPAARGAARPNYDLNVEVSSDGTVRVIPPLTNSVPATKPAQQR